MSESPHTQSQPDADFSVGSIVFERFKILNEIASGAKGRVYKVQDTLLNTTVALKVLLLDHKNDRDLVRFQSEARLASKMKHPGIATIFDFGIFGNTPFLSMEFVEGESLGSYLERHHTISVLELCEIMLQVCAAIDHAHTAGIVHRDLKPENIVISRNPDSTVNAKILDFGVAKNLDIVEEEGGKLTPTGNLIGSPNFMSPEQCRGSKDLSTKSDNYSLGCVMWTCIAGKPPFDSDSAMEVLARHVNEQPQNFQQVVDVPEKLATLIDGLLSKNPDDRPDLRSAVTPVLEELRDELSLSFRDPEDEETDTTDGAKDERTFIDYIVNRRNYVLFASGLTILVLLGVWVYQERTESSEKLATMPAQGHFDLGEQTELMGSKSVDRSMELLRLGQTNKISMSYGYKEGYLAECANLSALQQLDLSGTTVSDAETKHLVRIPNLTSLSMNGTRVTTLVGFADLKKVRTLALKNTPITNAALQNVAKMDNLSRLFINDTKVGDDGIKFLTSAKKLIQLDLSNTKITSKSAHFIKQLPSLRILQLNKTGIGESGLREILTMPSLRSITLNDCTTVDAKLLNTLKQDFPTIVFEKEALLGKLGKEFKKAHAAGDNKTAYDKIRRIVALSEKRFGSDSPMVASYYGSLAGVCVSLQKYEEAEQAIAKLSIYGIRTNDKTIQLSALDGQIAIAIHRGDLKKAIALCEKAMKLEDQRSGPYTTDALTRVMNLGNILKEAHEAKRALHVFDIATDRLKSIKNPDPDIGFTLRIQRGDLLRMLRRNAEATVVYKNLIDDLLSAPKLSDSGISLLFNSYAGLAATEALNGNMLAGLKVTDKMLELLKTKRIERKHEAALYNQRATYLKLLGRKEESEEYTAKFNQINSEKGKLKPIYR